MKEKFSSYRAFRADFEASQGNRSWSRVYNWTDPGVFASDVQRMLEASKGGYYGSERPKEDYVRVVRYDPRYTPSPSPAAAVAAAAPVRAPVHLPGTRISGEHARKKVRENLPDMETAFQNKRAKGRACTVMMLSHASTGGGGAEYFFVLATSDGAPPTSPRDVWTPTGNHEVIVWNWPQQRTVLGAIGVSSR
jgi:hypothetical protein